MALIAASTQAGAKAKADQPPPELLASVAVGPVTSLRNLQAYINAIQPGAGTALTDQFVRRSEAELIGARSLDGLDPVSWTYVLVASLDGAPAYALLGKVADAKTLATSAGAAHMVTKRGWAVIGPKPLLEHIGPYALSVIATQPTPKAPNATVYLPQLLARYTTEIEALRTQMLASLSQTDPGMMSQLMTSYIDGLGSLVTDTEKLVVTLEATPELGSLDFALTPKANSRLAKFVALQRPTDYALLDRLPATTPTILVGGHLEAGPYHDGLMTMMASMFGSVATKDLLAAMDAFRKTMTGDIAMAARIAPETGMTFTQLYQLSDTQAADKAVARMFELFKTARTLGVSDMPTTIKANPDTTTHDGITLRSYDTTIDLTKVQPAQRKAMESVSPGGHQRSHVATFDALGMVVASPDSLAEAKRSIDAARGKTARFVASMTVGELFAASHARKDSIAMMLDLGGIFGMITGAKAADLPMLMSFGFTDRKAHLRVALPAATLRAAVNLAQP